MSFTYKSVRKEKVIERRHVFQGSDETYLHSVKFDSSEEADTYIERENAISVLNCNKQTYRDYSISKKYALQITVVCHSGIVDVSAFKNDIHGIGTI